MTRLPRVLWIPCKLAESRSDAGRAAAVDERTGAPAEIVAARRIAEQ